MRSFSPKVAKLLFGALVVLGSSLAAAGVVFATTVTPPADTPPARCTPHHPGVG